MYRRDLLVRTGLLIGAGLLAAAPSAALADEPTTADDWGALRDQFELSRDWIHMGGLYLASHPAPVREAIERHRRGLDENPVHYLQERGPRLEAAVLRAAADYLGGAPTDIALTDSTTMGLGLLYDGLAVRADQDHVAGRVEGGQRRRDRAAEPHLAQVVVLDQRHAVPLGRRDDLAPPGRPEPRARPRKYRSPAAARPAPRPRARRRPRRP